MQSRRGFLKMFGVGAATASVAAIAPKDVLFKTISSTPDPSSKYVGCYVAGLPSPVEHKSFKMTSYGMSIHIANKALDGQ